MRIARRLLLYFFAAFFVVFGVAGLFDPAYVGAHVNLLPVSINGTSEIRSLYGGGFMAMGLVIFAGLRGGPGTEGLLRAMAIIFAGIVCGRVLSLLIDHGAAFGAPIALYELVLAACCYLESRPTQTGRDS